MLCEERRFLASDATALYYRIVTSDTTPPKGSALILHGMGEHGGRYLELADRLSRAGLTCLIPDLRGFGKSGGVRAHVGKFRFYHDDLTLLLNSSRLSLPETNRNLFFIGHSFGGLILASYLSQSSPAETRGMVLSSPFFGIAMKVPLALQMAAKIAAKLTPTLHQPNRVNIHALTHDEAILSAYLKDPLIDHRISVRLFAELSRQLTASTAMARALKVPAIIFQAGNDRVVSKEATRIFFEQLASQDKKLHILENAFHEVLQEKNRAAIHQEIIQWLLDRAHN